MTEMTYLNFDLVIRQTSDEEYHAEADIPGWKLAQVDFARPFSDEEVSFLREALGGPARDLDLPEGQRFRMATEYRQKVLSFGRRLYDTVFSGDLREGFSRRLTEARSHDLVLRIRLRLDDAPELAGLPWEYIYWRESQPPHLVLSNRTPIVRYLPLSIHAARVPPLDLPLNILVVLASPPRYPKLEIEDEWDKIDSTLRSLVQDGQVTVDRLPNDKYPQATQETLLNQLSLSGKPYHVFHFIGHGGFDAYSQPGLALDGGSDGKGEIVRTERLTMLLEHFSLRLAILNACEGARSSQWDSYSGVAQRLVTAGIPAVIVMQFKITDDAAIKFARGFYEALAAGLTVEASLTMARKKIALDNNPTEWGTPVLFSQSEDGLLFQINRPTEEQVRQAKIEALCGDAKAAIEKMNWHLAIEKLQAIVDIQETAGG